MNSYILKELEEKRWLRGFFVLTEQNIVKENVIIKDLEIFVTKRIKNLDLLEIPLTPKDVLIIIKKTRKCE